MTNDRKILIAIESFSKRHEGADRHFVANHTLVREGHPVLEGIEHLFKAIVPHYEVEAPAQTEKSLVGRAKDKVTAALSQTAAPTPETTETPATTETEPTLADRISAVAGHDDANALGKELGLEFADKKPSVAAKKTALVEAAAAAAASESDPDATE